MEEVSNHIPASLPDDLQSVGYNRQCHQRFPTNLYLLGDETEPEASISQQHHSPRRMSSTVPSHLSSVKDKISKMLTAKLNDQN